MKATEVHSLLRKFTRMASKRNIFMGENGGNFKIMERQRQYYFIYGGLRDAKNHSLTDSACVYVGTRVEII